MLSPVPFFGFIPKQAHQKLLKNREEHISEKNHIHMFKKLNIILLDGEHRDQIPMKTMCSLPSRASTAPFVSWCRGFLLCSSRSAAGWSAAPEPCFLSISFRISFRLVSSFILLRVVFDSVMPCGSCKWTLRLKATSGGTCLFSLGRREVKVRSNTHELSKSCS